MDNNVGDDYHESAMDRLANELRAITHTVKGERAMSSMEQPKGSSSPSSSQGQDKGKGKAKEYNSPAHSEAATSSGNSFDLPYDSDDFNLALEPIEISSEAGTVPNVSQKDRINVAYAYLNKVSNTGIDPSATVTKYLSGKLDHKIPELLARKLQEDEDHAVAMKLQQLEWGPWKINGLPRSDAGPSDVAFKADDESSGKPLPCKHVSARLHVDKPSSRATDSPSDSPSSPASHIRALLRAVGADSDHSDYEKRNNEEEVESTQAWADFQSRRGIVTTQSTSSADTVKSVQGDTLSSKSDDRVVSEAVSREGSPPSVALSPTISSDYEIIEDFFQ